MHGTLVVRVATLAEVRPLQQAVLRPDGPLPGEPPVPEDMQCVGAYDDGVLVGTGAVLRRPWPGPGSLPEPVWQLRSMAVDSAHRGRGVGSAVLAAATELARAEGAVSLWAEARVAALGLYRRAGWTIVGDEWVKPWVGPHRWIRRDLSALPGTMRSPQ